MSLSIPFPQQSAVELMELLWEALDDDTDEVYAGQSPVLPQVF